MRELLIKSDGKPHVFLVPAKYAEMDEKQFRTAMLLLMHLSERETFWENYAGIPHRFCGSLPEWVMLEMEKMLEFISELNEKLDHFIIEKLPLLGFFRHSSLTAPGPMLDGVSLQQFMTADNFFSYYTVTQRESFIDLLCASLYLKENETFIVTNRKERLVPLQEREHWIHKHVPTEVRFGVFVNWIFIKNWLSDAYPHLFRKGKSDGKPKACDWLPLFDSFVGDNVPFIKDYQQMHCLDAFRIIDGKIKQQDERK